MAMELEFWLPDGPDGEQLDFAVRVSAGTMIPTMDRYWREDHVVATLRHTSRQKGEWCVRVKKGYTSGTKMTVGKLNTVYTDS